MATLINKSIMLRCIKTGYFRVLKDACMFSVIELVLSVLAEMNTIRIKTSDDPGFVFITG